MSHIGIATDPKIAWAMAFDTGVRSQAMVDLMESEAAIDIGKAKRRRKYRDVAESDKGEEVALTYTRECVSAKQDGARKGGAGAAHGVDYWPIYARIKRMERVEPWLAAIGHCLCHPDMERANDYLDDVVALVEAEVIASIPNWDDGRAWKPAKKLRAHFLIRVAVMERQRNLSNEQPAWAPEKVGALMAGWYGMPIVTRDWSRDWLPVWVVMHAVIDRLEADAMEPISDVIGEMARASRSRAA